MFLSKWLRKWKIKRRSKFEKVCWLAHKRHELNLAIEQAVLDDVISPDQAELIDLRFGLKDGEPRSIAQIARNRKPSPFGSLGAERDIDMGIWATMTALRKARFKVIELDLDELEDKALVQLGYADMNETEIKELENSRSLDQLRQVSEMEKRELAK